MELVTEFCFKRDDDINEEVLKKIMGYVFQSANNKTKQFSPMDDFALDPSPTIRSFILQQLLYRYPSGQILVQSQ